MREQQFLHSASEGPTESINSKDNENGPTLKDAEESPTERAVSQSDENYEILPELDPSALTELPPETENVIPINKLRPQETTIQSELAKDHEGLIEIFGMLRDKYAERNSSSAKNETYKPSEYEKAFVINLIKFASRQNEKIAQDIILEGFAQDGMETESVSETGLKSIITKVLSQHDYMGQLRSLLEAQPDGAEAMKALQSKLPKMIEDFRKSSQQKKGFKKDKAA